MSSTTASTATIKKVRHSRRVHFSFSKLIIYVLLSLWALTTIFPLVWVAINSFKYKGAIRSESFSLPLGDLFTTDNYQLAFKKFDIFSAYGHSLFISVSVTVLVVLLAGFAAYALVRYEFKGKKILNAMVVASMMFPVFSTIIPVYRMLAHIGLASSGDPFKSMIATILPQVAGNLSFAIIVLMGFIRSVPIDLEESAYLDGASIPQIFFRIIIPVAKPSFATVAIFSFLWSYNDLFTQMFFLRTPQERTITLLLNEINSKAGTDYGLMAASVMLVVVPVLIVYIILQKNIIKGLTAGAIKG